MRQKANFLVFISVWFCGICSGQNWCAFESVDSIHHHIDKRLEQMLQDRQQRILTSENEVFKIPVVVHVIHNNSSNVIGLGNNISDEQIFSAIEVLNEDFRRKNADTVNTPTWAKPVAADMQIEFELAKIDPNGNLTNGITRHYSSKASFSVDFESDKALKSFGYWPNNEYLNIWVASLTGGIVGYAQFPNYTGLQGIDGNNGSDLTDGVVIAPFAFGRLTGKANGLNNPYRYGRTAVHEVGHWLGLRHIFNNDENGCNYSDYCEDTPPQDKSNLGLKICDTAIVGGCGAIVMHSNYMDYTNDFCMNIFTQDQKNRMHAAIVASPSRAALKYSKALCGSNLRVETPFTENFSDLANQNKKWVIKSDSAMWAWEDGKMIANVENLIYDDSLVFESGVFNYKKSEKNKLRLTLSNENSTADSVKIYYEISCSGTYKLLKTIYLDPNQTIEEIISLQDVASDGLMKIFVVFYANGNAIELDDFSIYQESANLTVILYPNPTDRILNYKLNLPREQKISIKLFDVNGKLCISEEKTMFSGIYEMNLTGFESGTYIVNFVSDTESVSRRIVIN
jgi:hypothetical protein